MLSNISKKFRWRSISFEMVQDMVWIISSYLSHQAPWNPYATSLGQQVVAPLGWCKEKGTLATRNNKSDKSIQKSLRNEKRWIFWSRISLKNQARSCRCALKQPSTWVLLCLDGWIDRATFESSGSSETWWHISKYFESSSSSASASASASASSSSSSKRCPEKLPVFLFQTVFP